MISPILYTTLIKKTIKVLSFDSVSKKLYFDDSVSEIRKFIGKDLKFYDTQNRSNVGKIGNDPIGDFLFLHTTSTPINEIVVDSIFSVYESFSVTGDNELVTFQDINERLLPTKSTISQTSNDKNVVDIAKGQSGIINGLEKAILSKLPIFVYSTNNDLDVAGRELITLLVENGVNTRMQLVINNKLLDFDLSFIIDDTNNYVNVLIEVNQCQFGDSEKLSFTFDKITTPTNTYCKVSCIPTDGISKTFSFGYTLSINNIDNPYLGGGTELSMTIGSVSTNIITLDSSIISVSSLDTRKILVSSDLDDATLTEVVKSSETFGGYTAGENLPIGTTFTEFAKRLLEKIFYPTFVNPSMGLSVNVALQQERGTTLDIIASTSFNRGQILGKLVGGIWNASTMQDYRSGAFTKVLFDSVDNELSLSKTFANKLITDGINTITASINYSIGVQPKDSANANSGAPYPAGSVSRQISIYGYPKLFWDIDSVDVEPYTSSLQIRAMINSLLNPVVGTVFTINIPQGAKMVQFSYPDTMPDITNNSVKYVEGLGATIGDLFEKSIVSVEGANGYFPIDNKVYTYVPVGGFSENATYVITL